jgi:hypothetical protein
LKCDGTRAETRFRLSTKRTSPFKSAGALVQSTTGSQGVRISGSNAGYMFRGSMKSTGYTLHLPVSSSLLLPCVTVCHHISTGLYQSEESTRTSRQNLWNQFTHTIDLYFYLNICFTSVPNLSLKNTFLTGHAVAHLFEALRYKPEGRGFDSRWCHWNFSLT